MDADHTPAQPSRMRIGDADRQRVAEVLRDAAGEGRIGLDELEERLEATWGATVYADLVPIVVDLPGGLAATGTAAVPSAAVPSAAVRHDLSLAVMSGQDRRGVWEVGETHTALALMGGVVLDLREAVLSARETTIHAYAVMGGVEVVVNAGTRVSVEGFGVMGGFEQQRDTVAPVLGPDSPLVRVKGLALMGGVTVVRKPVPGETTKRPRLLGG
ncbi:DUF1707 SHOCT-like domain-containing protein [Nocardioides sp. AX2bis]|uniref:DUF1707 SHOCT-like domain-containing protein n=1 Tax=Nocardioides sp. AX2bis TaxID=2653157 RepID=UPI0012F3F30A|nr:DUF1707 domain-containing protein [Nocardioides sp. AX2bis]VXC01825.1 conserved hypothetical protein [Nocardioides sp. AX2bis]